mmetsp:Transcript_22190/g.32222  ORF Transcript_22190/g.32222 Transcript_22190/m.32222 type:complete len:278 (-) Transcript_22190:51-884(-)
MFRGHLICAGNYASGCCHRLTGKNHRSTVVCTSTLPWANSFSLSNQIALCEPNVGSISYDKDHYPNGLNFEFTSFEKDKLMATKGILMECHERGIKRAAHDIVKSLGKLHGLRIADIGAGTGFLAKIFSEKVGNKGSVYAIDISAGFISHLKDLFPAESFPNLKIIQCTDQSIGLPPASIDLAFICDTYHHFTNPESIVSDIHRSLSKSGRLVVIDFHRDANRVKPPPGAPDYWVLQHVRASQDVFRSEIESCGFRFVCEVCFESMPDNYMMIFEKV